MATADTHLIFDIYLISLTIGLPVGVENNHLIKLNHKMVHHRTTILHVIPHINYHSLQKHQTDNDSCWRSCFDQSPGIIAISSNVLIQQCEVFWVLSLNKRSHIHADLFNSYFLSAILLDQHQFGSLSRDQP